MRLAIITLLLLAAPVLAGADDLELARGLIEKKHYDLAREVLDRVVNDRSRPAPERAEGRLELARLLAARCRDAFVDPRKPVAAVLALFAEARHAYDRFLLHAPHSPRAT